MSNWIVEINSKLNDILANPSSCQEQQQLWQKRSIYRIPTRISDLNKKAYQPQVVSFGPYHHEVGELKLMAGDKQRALLRFLRRNPQRSLQSIFDSIHRVAKELKDCYDSLNPKWQQDTEGFVKMMILDGCFMLEILHASTEPMKDGDDEVHNQIDPIFGDHGKMYVMPFIRRDMLLLENQLPMLLLVKLQGIMIENDEIDKLSVPTNATKILMNMQQGMASLNKLILQFCDCRRFIDSSILDKYYLHVLDLYRKSLLHTTPNSKPSSRWDLYWKSLLHTTPKSKPSSRARHRRGGLEDAVIRSATELHEAGVRFRPSTSRSLKDISFSECGILRLPVFSVDDTTEFIFLNLIAFERCHIGAGHDVTSFICFMDNIIDHSRDVGLLNSNHVLQNLTGSDKAAAEIFNTMSKDLTIDSRSDLAMVHSDVAAYCKEPLNAWRANFKHTYCRSPWALVSVLAAAFLFGLTIIQTLYSVLQYDQGKSAPSPH